jgi:hypothetical protein
VLSGVRSSLSGCKRKKAKVARETMNFCCSALARQPGCPASSPSAAVLQMLQSIHTVLSSECFATRAQTYHPDAVHAHFNAESWRWLIVLHRFIVEVPSDAKQPQEHCVSIKDSCIRRLLRIVEMIM